MSVTFTITGIRVDGDDPTTHLNLANTNAADLLRWLGVGADGLVGEICARELAARCRRRLWDVPRNHDAPRPECALAGPGHATVVWCDRPGGYLRTKTVELLALADRAGHGAIRWA